MCVLEKNVQKTKAVLKRSKLTFLVSKILEEKIAVAAGVNRGAKRSQLSL
jgi:hypothetical protein